MWSLRVELLSLVLHASGPGPAPACPGRGLAALLFLRARPAWGSADRAGALSLGGDWPLPSLQPPWGWEGAALTQPNPGGLGQFSLLQLASERGPLPSSIWAGQPGRGPAGWLCVPAPAECGWKESRGLGVPEILQAGCRQRPDGPELWVQKQLVKPARPLLAPALEGWAHLGEGGLCSQSMHTCWQVHRGRATQAQD